MAARTTSAAGLRAFGLIAGLVLTLGVAMAGKAAAAQIRLCAGPGMQPPCVALTHGLTDLRQADLGAPVASFSLNTGAWLFCTEAGFRGRCTLFSQSRPHLKGTAFEAGAASLRPVREAGGGRTGRARLADPAWQRLALAIHEGRNYTGRSWVIADDFADLGADSLPIHAGSVRVLGGRWQVCRASGYEGCREIQRGLPDLKRSGFAGGLHSVRLSGSAAVR